MNHHRKIAVRTLAEILAANLLFFVVDWFSGKIATGLSNRAGQALVLGGHLIVVLLMVFIVMRSFQRVDEYLQLQMLENMAITTAVIFIGCCIYGSLEMVGFRSLSMFIICPAMGTVFAIVTITRRIAAR
jgi:hypothetical protein